MKRYLHSPMCILLAFLWPILTVAQPVANFTANATSGCSPIVVQFTDQSTGSPTSWYWDLGNGTTSVLQNPSTTYFNAGTYTVSLIATNAGGSNTKIRTNYITVYPSPVVGFYGDSTSSCPPKTVSFTNTSVPGGSGTVTYLWDFGDGYTSTAISPTHTYSGSGNFTVTLIVTNGNGCTSSLTKTNYIPVLPKPVTAFTSSVTSSCSYPVTANFTNSTTNAVSYNWNFGDGGTSTAANPSHTYTAPGTYTVRLISTSSLGCVDTLVKTSYISVGTLHAAMSVSPSPACANQNVYFTNTSSTANVTWQFGDATVSNSTNPVHAYSSPGTYIAKVIAINGSCTDTAQQTIIVSSVPSIQFTASPTDGCSTPFTTLFTNSSSGATSYYWIFGDGGTSTSTSPSHTYNAFGNYTVRLAAVNASGCSDTLTKTAYIKVQTPTDSIGTNDYSGCAPATVIFTAYVTTNIPVSNYSWNFGDGSPVSSCASCSTQTHTYTTSGTYIATLTYTTGTGCVYSKTKTILVPTKPTASFTASPLVVCPGQIVTFSNSSTGATSYYWIFGDGSASTVTNPTYSYTTGTYTVTLIANNNGCKDTLTRVNYITVNLPRASFSPSYSCSNRLSYVFTDNSIGANTYSWNFGDGATSTSSGTMSHTYAAYGSYTVSLLVTNTATGCSSTYQRVIQVYPLATAFSANDTTICPGDQVTFSGTTNTVISNYSWSFGDNLTANGTTAGTTHVYGNPGIYTVKLVVSDTANCKDSLIKTAYIRVGGPTVNFSGSPTAGCPGLNVSFTDLSTTNAGFSLGTRSWDFGDGATATTGSANISHVYNTAGTFSVTLTVTDANACTGSLVRANYIVISKPVPLFSTADTNACLGQPVTFTNTSTGNNISSFWSFGDGGTSTATSPSHAYAATGNYTVKLVVTESGGCKDSLIRTNYIHVNAPTVGFTLSDTFAACPPLAVNATNTSSGASTYAWTFGNGGQSTLTNPSTVYTYPGVYTIKLIAQNTTGCKDSATKNVTILGPTGTFSYSPISGCTPLTVNFSSTTSGTTTLIWDLNNGYTQNTTSSTLTYTYTSSGRYVPKLILSDGASCLVPIQGIDTIKVDHIDADFSFTPSNLCNSGTVQFTDTTLATITAVNTRSWSFGDLGTSTAHNPSHNYAAPGIYTVRLIIGNTQGCLDTVIKTVTIHALPNVSAAPNQSICQGSTTPVSITATGAASYIWTPTTSLSCSNCANPTVLPASTTTYMVTGTDTNGCTDTGNVTITVNPKPAIGAGSNQTICAGNSVTLGATGGTSYVWTPATGLSCTACANPVATPAVTTTYKVTGTSAAGCSDTAIVTITVNARPTVNAGSNVTICAGDSAPLSATGTAVSYVWSPATGLSCTACTNPTATPASTTTYTVTGTGANSCTNTSTVTVTVNARPTVSAGSNQTICTGSSVTLNATGAVSYVWTPGTGLSCTNCASPLASPTATTTYTVTGTGANGCTNTANVTVTVNALPPVSAGPNQTTCPNIPVSLLATGATTYVWSPSTGLTCTACANPTATISTTTTYTVTGTNSNGCVNTSSVTITVNPQPNISAGSNTAICIGDSAQLNATGGLTYSWSPTTGLSCTTCANPKASPGVTTTYIVTGTVGTGCSNTSSVTVTVNARPAVSAGSNQTICIGNSATLTATGAVSYVWSPSTGLSCTSCASPTASPTVTTTYTVTGTNANGCTNTATVTVNVNSLPTVSAGSNQSICPGSSTPLLATGAVSYVWSPATGLSCTACANPTATPATTTTYTVTGTNANGCTNTSTVTITVVTQPTVSGGPNKNICIGSGTSLLATGASTYTWSPATGLSCTSCANPTANPVITTTYTVIGIAGNGCSDTAQVLVTVNALPLVSAGPNKNICIGASTTLTATGASTYIWSPASTLSCTACITTTATPPVTTVYTVTGTDANGCSNTSNVTVSVYPIPVITVSGRDSICQGDTTQLLASGATTYNWTPATGLSCTACPNPVANPLVNTIYTVTGTTNGCAGSTQHAITILQLPAVSAGSDQFICTGNSTVLHASGAGNYIWTPASGLSCVNCPDPIATPSSTTTYIVIGTNGRGCSDTGIVRVVVYPSPGVFAGNDTTLCYGLPFQLTGKGAATYTWIPGTYLSCTNCPDPVIIPKAQITYKLIGVDANGCSDSDDVIISVREKNAVSAGPDDTLCVGKSVQLHASGGTDYVWSPSTGLDNNAVPDPTASPVATTTYSVIIKQGVCFADTEEVHVMVFNNPTVSLGPDQTAIYGSIIELNAVGNDITKYVWANVEGLSCYDCAKPTATPLKNSTYVVTVYNQWGCEAKDDINIYLTCDQNEIFIANTFTPNKDGNNDKFFPQGKGVSEVKRFSIYNRWGQLVYEVKDVKLNDPGIGWDGTFKNEPLKPDVFVYLLIANCNSGEPIEIKGDVSLIR